MATTKSDIEEWLKEGKRKKASHMIVVCDTFSYEDFPVYVMPSEDIETRVARYSNVGMQKVMEVYHLNGDLDEQLKEQRSYHV